MHIQAKKGDILKDDAGLRIVGVYEQEDWNNAFIERLDQETGGKLSRDAKKKEFTGKVGQSLSFPTLLVVGLGPQKLIKSALREVTGLVFQMAQLSCEPHVSMELFGEDEEDFDALFHGQALAEAFLLSAYQFDAYKKPKTKNCLESITLVAENGHDAIRAQKGIERAMLVIDGVTVARDLVNTPGHDMSPVRLAQTAEKIAKMSPNVSVRIFNREQIEKKRMGAYLAVAKGSEEEPRFIHLIYKPDNTKKRVALVGKGITFDSGGLSLKPSEAMESMKCDMAGAATVLGVFAILARLEPSVEVHGIIAATENMPSGKAIRPGDIVHASNKKTIEIRNTDAEGRLTLADALVYAQKQDVDYIIDLATLTGACMVALGEEIAGLMSNNHSLAESLLNSSKKTQEPTWELPLYPRYKQLIESEVADLRNTSTTRYGGVLTAGLFLEEFIENNTPWAHIDIAGPAFAERPLSSYLGKGATGFGVRTLIDWIESL